MMGFSDAVRNALMNNYVNFNGRASRSEYWWFFLFTMILQFIALPIDIVVLGYDMMDPGAIQIVGTIAGLALFLPSLCVLVRRLHDLGKSGWWFLIALIPFLGIIVLLVFMVTEGEQLPNQYGEVPTNTIKQDERYHY
tara:strand:+ start:348 stop:761 length:414 start_codon:yes stop_codon:yes gene_type:complete